MVKLRPFQILKLIRDGEISNVYQLKPKGIRSGDFYGLFGFLRSLKNAQWIKVNKEGHIELTGRLSEMQEALGISLSRLSAYASDSIISDPLFGFPKTPPSPVELFVLMPFSEDMRPVYEDHIRPVASKLRVSVKRADDFFAATSIMSDVWNAINQARVLIADCTGRNPNVFYELGIAHTLGKQVVLVAQSKDDIPFDVRHIRAIIYNFSPRGMREFETALEATILNELKQPQTIFDLLESE